MECPNCHVNLSTAVTVPNEQRFSLRLKSESEMFSLSTIGGVLQNTDELLKAVAEDAGFKAHIMIEAIDYKPHEIKVDLIILRVAAEATDA